jgi:hypothetical protein
MDDRSRNIDIIFRNGLKEFEVLPPPEVWENVSPTLVRKQRSLNTYRIAAMIAILVSLTALAAWFTNSVSLSINGPALAMNQETMPGGSYVIPVNLGKKISSNQNSILSEPVQARAPQIVGENFIIYPVVLSSDVTTSTPVDISLEMGTPPSKSKVLFSERKEVTGILAASEKQKQPSPGKWTIAAMASPDYYSSVSSGQTASELSRSEQGMTSFSGGMGVTYKMNRRVSIQSGLIYSSIGQKVSGVASYSGFDRYNTSKGEGAFTVQTLSGTIVTTNPNVFLKDNVSTRVISQYTSNTFDPVKANLAQVNNYITQNFRYVEIPVMLRFKAIDKAIDINLIGGLSYNLLVGNSAFTFINGVKLPVGKTEGLNMSNLSSAFGLGLEYSLSGNISLNLEPTFRYYLTPFGNLSGSSVHPYAFGVFSGLSYKF